MKNMINELWHGNIVPQSDSRTNSLETKELLGYMARLDEKSEELSQQIKREESGEI